MSLVLTYQYVKTITSVQMAFIMLTYQSVKLHNAVTFEMLHCIVTFDEK